MVGKPQADRNYSSGLIKVLKRMGRPETARVTIEHPDSPPTCTSVAYLHWKSPLLQPNIQRVENFSGSWRGEIFSYRS
tara:strand:+ start:578 stop:811 length:234 start_codon:yes stop_codon:yes gene_type:complete